MATWLIRFLKRQTNCGRVVIKEKRVNRRSDFGLKVPCEYIFEGAICSLSGCFERIGEEFNVERCLGLYVFSTDSICIFGRPSSRLGGYYLTS